MRRRRQDGWIVWTNYEKFNRTSMRLKLNPSNDNIFGKQNRINWKVIANILILFASWVVILNFQFVLISVIYNAVICYCNCCILSYFFFIFCLLFLQIINHKILLFFCNEYKFPIYFIYTFLVEFLNNNHHH